MSLQLYSLLKLTLLYWYFSRFLKGTKSCNASHITCLDIKVFCHRSPLLIKFETLPRKKNKQHFYIRTDFILFLENFEGKNLTLFRLCCFYGVFEAKLSSLPYLWWQNASIFYKNFVFFVFSLHFRIFCIISCQDFLEFS